MAWESHHNIHSLRAAPDFVKPLPSSQLHFFFYRLNYHDRHDMNSWMEMHLPSSLYIHTLLDERSMRSLESAATSSWQKKKWKHHNHKENNKQTKTWKATPEEDENDDTFTGWVSSCENSSSDHLWRTSSYFCVSTEISQQQLMILFLTWQVATLRSASHSSFSSGAVIHSLLVLVFATSVSCFAFDQLVDLWWVTHRFLIMNVTINRIMSYYPECCVHVKFTRW